MSEGLSTLELGSYFKIEYPHTFKKIPDKYIFMKNTFDLIKIRNSSCEGNVINVTLQATGREK